MVDRGAGTYETTAAELEPIAHVVVERARIMAGENVVDVACGTGNAALIAAARNARVVGVDAAPRLLGVARERARADRVVLDFREGDLLALPVDDAAADVVLSVFGVIFAVDPAGALREIARILRPGGRVLLAAWIPDGPIHAMLVAMGRIIGRVTSAPPPRRTAWADPDVVASLSGEAGLVLAESRRANYRSERPRRSVRRRGTNASDGRRGQSGHRTSQGGGRGTQRDDCRLARGQRGPKRRPYVVHELRAG